jgi:DNA-directed RNA polymerase
LDLRDSEEATRERFDRQNRPETAKGRRREALQIPAYQRAAEPLLARLADFLAGKLEQQPDAPPAWLVPLINGHLSAQLALAILAPLMDRIYRGWDDVKDKRQLPRALKQEMGKSLRDHLDADWLNSQCVEAGEWMLMAAVMTLNCFTLNKLGVPEIVPDCKIEVDALRDEMMRSGQVFMPFTEEPPDWTGYRKRYDSWFVRRFVGGARGGHPEYKKNISDAFLKNFEHGKAVNNLKRVPLMVDPATIALVERYGTLILNRDLVERIDALERAYAALPQLKRIGPPKISEWMREKNLLEKIKKTTDKIDANARTVKDDLRVARMRAGQPFWLDYYCDFRGRAYPLQFFNYQRPDHVRALFRFANGARLTEDGLKWLEVHCAKCEGSTDKDSIVERRKWVSDHKADILKIADGPDETFDLWSNADAPFAYVAACRELKAAWENPRGFVSHMPIPFDGSCNGIQHLALLIRDKDAARRVNLVRSEKPQDIYLDVALRVKAKIEAEAHSDELAAWWRDCFRSLSTKEIRKLCKRPVMTFPYGVTVPEGMRLQLSETYYRELRRNSRPPAKAWDYLAFKIDAVAKELLPGPAAVMDYLRKLAEYCANKGRQLKWINTSGFPVINLYVASNVKTVKLFRKYGADRARVRHKVADSFSGKIGPDEFIGAIRGAAPNYVHSMDAAHLALLVNLAVQLRHPQLHPDGIKDILTVHDSFACHASTARYFRGAILAVLTMMYWPYGFYLRGLHRDNTGSSDDFPLPPPMGELEMHNIPEAHDAFL